MIREERTPLADLTADQLDDLYRRLEAHQNAPVLRHCLIPGCLREYDIAACMAGDPPSRPSWSGQGWRKTRGTLTLRSSDICPDHVELFTAHMPRRLELPSGRWSIDCGCGWTPTPQRWHGVLRALWEQHILTVTGHLPEAPPPTDPENRTALADLTEYALADLYDRLWDAEADLAETRDTARACILSYSTAVPALLGVKTSLEALRQRIVTDSRDWTDDKLDAWLWAVLVGFNCEITDEGHVHDDLECSGDQALWHIGRRHGIPTDQTIQASHLRWWVANAVKVAQQTEAQSITSKEA